MKRRRQQKKNTILLFWILALLTVLVIFSLSSKDATRSTDDSSVVCRFLAEHLIEGFDDMSLDQQKQILREMQHPVRKTAHMIEYTILGCLFCLALGNRSILRYPGAWCLTVVCAAFDEYHQTFVPGRSGELRDIMIDGTGALLGILIIPGIGLAMKSFRNRKPFIE